MFEIISPEKAHRILADFAEWIDAVSARYDIPAAVVKAILYQEMTTMNAMDPVADFVVSTNLFNKKDSSTGYAQIFGYVGLNAANFAVDRGLATYESLGIACDHRLDPADKSDVRLVWNLLHDNPKANIEIATLNLLVAAEEMTGRIDFASYSEDELKLILTRYNANVDRVTDYGEQAYAYYVEFAGNR